MQQPAEETCAEFEIEDGSSLKADVAPLLATSKHELGKGAVTLRTGAKVALITGLAVALLVAGASWPSPLHLGAPHVLVTRHPFETLWEDSSTLASKFQLTRHNYTDSDHTDACSREFGSSYRIADWVYDIRPLSNDQVISLCKALEINLTFNAGNFFVSREGENFYSGSRAYFFERHDGHPPSNWLVHDIKSSITLGSWVDISGPVLCAKKSVTQQDGIVHKIDAGASEYTTTIPFVGYTTSMAKDKRSVAMDIVQVSPNVVDLCGDIPAKQVFDVQWSGSESQTDQGCSGFAVPYEPNQGVHLAVDWASDHFRLGETPDGSHVLQLFDMHGEMKGQLSGGMLKLASAEVAFYIIDGWYATIITKSAKYTYGDAATFKDLTPEPGLMLCEVAKPKPKIDAGASEYTTTTPFVGYTTAIPEDKRSAAMDIVQVSPSVVNLCGDIPAKQVFDVQWSASEGQTDQDCSEFAAPYDPHQGVRLAVDRAFDHFRLGETPDGSHVLQLFDLHGQMKGQLSGGMLKLANAEVAFYIIDGWYATIITKSDKYTYGDAATFKDLTPDPRLTLCDVAHLQLINTSSFKFLQVDRAVLE